MAVINILAFTLLTLLLAFHWKEKIVDVVPVTACILILLLYILAFFRGLSAIDWLAGIFVAAAVGALACRCRDRKKRGEILEWLRQELLHPGVIVAVLVFAGTAALAGGRVADWWDDINFWATDVKALYGLNGFAAKYANAASEFGDYPPGVQLMKWWFVHMAPERFSEGLMFTGYYFCVFVFLMPLLRRMKGRNPVLLVLAAVCLWAFPSVAEAFYCQGMCADLVMAVIYGAFLAAAMDGAGHQRSFQDGRLALYLAVLVLVKSVGFLWAAFGLAFLWIRKWMRPDGEVRTARYSAASLLLVTAAPVITGGSWMAFCLLMRRAAKLTGSALSIASGNLPVLLPGTRETLVKAFLEAFAVWPLHRSSTWAIDLSPLAMFVLLLLLTAWFWRRGRLTKAEAGLLGAFLTVSGLVFYGINLVSHLTIFAAETQYLEPFAMVSSIERYGAPFTIGSLYLFAFLLLERGGLTCPRFWQGKRAGALWRRDGAYLICIAFVVLCANWPEVWNGLYGYSAQRETKLAARAEMITEESAEFLAMVSVLDAGSGMRILYMQDAAVNQWVKNAYVAYEASPVSLIFGSIDCETMNSGDMWSAMNASHAGYLYLDEIAGDAAALFEPFAENIQAHTLYRIVEENGQIRLEPAALSDLPTA